MKKLLLALFFAFVLVLTQTTNGVANNKLAENDTIAKINFTWDNTWDVEGWTSVYGGTSFPITLNNGVSILYTGGDLAMGTSGEPTSTVVPDKVSNTYNWLSNASETPGDFTITGLDPQSTYSFVIFASRDGASASGDRTTTYTIVGTTISGSVNPVGNKDKLVVLKGIQPSGTGGVQMQVTKLEGNYGYINALIIYKGDYIVGGQGPYGGIPWPIPGKIEAEDFDIGGEGISYHDTDPTNNGIDFGGTYRPTEGVDIVPEDEGNVIGWFLDGEWMEYTVNVEAGTYDINVRAGTPNAGLQLAVFMNDTLITMIDIVQTGATGSGQYEPMDISTKSGIELTGGEKILKLMTIGQDFDFNWIEFVRTDNVVEEITIDTVAKINFTFDNTWDVEGWTSAYGGGSFPITLANGITIEYTGGNLAMGTSGEPTSTVVPDKVSNTYGWLSNADETPGTFTITGLDADSKYSFIIFASRDGASSSGDRTTTYSIVGTTITGSVNPVGNKDQLVVLSNITPSGLGAVLMTITKLVGNYGYINGLIIGKQVLPNSANVIGESIINVYPNPVMNELNISNLSGQNRIELFNFVGRKVLDVENYNSSQVKIGMSELIRGAYILRIVNQDKSEVKSFKIIKK